MRRVSAGSGLHSDEPGLAHTGHSLRLQDYRDIADGPFDAVCSIEMVEAVGENEAAFRPRILPQLPRHRLRQTRFRNRHPSRFAGQCPGNRAHRCIHREY